MGWAMKQLRHSALAWTAAGFLATALSGACGTGGHTPDRLASSGNQALDYYPLVPGWGWAYQVERDGDNVLAPYSVAERTADGAVVKNGDQQMRYAILPEGIARRDGSSLGDFVLRNPVRQGTTWKVENGQATIVAAGVPLRLPSGDYPDCAVVEETRHDPERVTRTTFCRGVGPVDIEMRVFDPFKKTFEIMAHARLLSVTRPED
jgi:hypothetical protein